MVAKTKACSVADCKKSATHKGWCPAHYRRWRKYGDPLGKRPGLSETSARTQIRDWVKDIIQDADEVNVPTVASQAYEHFMKASGFTKRFYEENAGAIVHDIVADVVANTRRYIPMGNNAAATRQGVRRRAQEHAVFSRWLEHANGRHIRLLEMTKKDLLAAADERERRGDTEYRIANLLRALAAPLTDEDIAGGIWSPQQIEQKYQEMLNP